jgi:hypothetical protein
VEDQARGQPGACKKSPQHKSDNQKHVCKPIDEGILIGAVTMAEEDPTPSAIAYPFCC